MSKKPLDHLILVGFPPLEQEDEETQQRIIRHLMDVFNVQKKGIRMFPEETSIDTIVLKTFIPDKASKSGFMIGNTLCIASDDINMQYRKKIERLTKFSINVKTGYDQLSWGKTTESGLSQWAETGIYPESDESSDQTNSIDDTDDFLDSILGGIPEDDESISISEDDENSSNNASDTGDDTLDNDTPGISESQSVPIVANETPPIDNEPEDTIPQEDSEPPEDSFKGGLETSEYSPDTNNFLDDESGSKDSSYESEGDSRATNNKPQEDNSPVEETSSQASSQDIQKQPQTTPDQLKDTPSQAQEDKTPHTSQDTQKENDSSGLLEDGKWQSLFEDEENNFSEGSARKVEPPRNDDTPSKIKESEKTQQDISSVFSSLDDDGPEDVAPTSPHMGDDLDDDGETYHSTGGYVDIAGDGDLESTLEERRKKKLQEDKKRQEELEQLGKKSALQRIREESQFAKTAKGADEIDARSKETIEDHRRDDGERKNYKEYLTRDEAKQQETLESSRKNFGDVDSILSPLSDQGVNKDGEDLHYVPADKGRIVMVSSGKGGVGKSLVSSGLAISLALGKAQERRTNPGTSSSRTWLVESDYNSPQMSLAFGTGKKDIGRVAELISDNKRNTVTVADIRKSVEENGHYDSDTGVTVLACPNLSTGRSSKNIPRAIVLAVRYISEICGDDVIIDHGNLTTGEYSDVDLFLSMRIAHRVVVVGNMGCLPETQSVLSLLTQNNGGGSLKPRAYPSVSVVLNSARKQQYYLAQDKLRPFNIINVIPPIDALKPENSTGEEHLNDMPNDVRKAIIDRCGIMLPKLGFESMRRYFSGASAPINTGGKSGASFFRKLADFLTGNK